MKTLLATILTLACGAAATAQPLASLPAVTCAGTEASAAATEAHAALLRAGADGLSRPDREAVYAAVLAQAEAGRSSEPQNAYFPYLATLAHVGLGQTDPAAAAFAEATRCPGLGEAAVTRLMEQALHRYQSGDPAGALALWQAVTALDASNVEAHYNQGVVLSEQGDPVRAVEAFGRVAGLPVAAGDLEAAQWRTAAIAGLLGAGVALFTGERYEAAAEVFEAIYPLDPHHRDAAYNHALTLYKLESWPTLVPVAARLLAADPLNYNAHIILFNAHKGLSDRAKAQNDAAAEVEHRMLALETLEQAEALPVQVDQVWMEMDEGRTVVRGVVTGGSLAEQTPVRLAFTLTTPEGEAGQATATVAAPAKGMTASFEVTVPTTATPSGWRYRLEP